jgi:hypothetical protein
MTKLDKINIDYNNQINLPDYNDEIVKQYNITNYEIDNLKKQSDIFYNQFSALLNLNKYDKLGIFENNLYIQKLSPWRYFVRKYKNQNRISLALYFNIEIQKYAEFLNLLYNTYNEYYCNIELHNIVVKNYEFISNVFFTIKNLRDKYNLKSNSQEISRILESILLKFSKYKSLFIKQISNKRFELQRP